MKLENILHENLLKKLHVDKKGEPYQVIILTKERLEPEPYSRSMTAIKGYLEQQKIEYDSKARYGLITGNLTRQQIYFLANNFAESLDRIAENEEIPEMASTQRA